MTIAVDLGRKATKQTNKQTNKERKAKIRNLCNRVPSRTQNTIWESDLNSIIHNTQESQEVSLFPKEDHKAARNRQDSLTRIIKSAAGMHHTPPSNIFDTKTIHKLRAISQMKNF